MKKIERTITIITLFADIICIMISFNSVFASADDDIVVKKLEAIEKKIEHIDVK